MAGCRIALGVWPLVSLEHVLPALVAQGLRPVLTPKGIERAILKLLEQRHPKTACPSEVARAIAPDAWRAQMQPVRDAARRLMARGRIDVLQRGRKVDPKMARGAIRLRLAAAAAAYRQVDFREHPERYRIGRGEQGVLTVEPYKSELLPLWRFKTEREARQSSRALYAAFVKYRKAGDFVGMDMARKFVQMGYTRARRYANHASGRKYDGSGRVKAKAPDAEKARAAAVFHRVWRKIAADRRYAVLREQHQSSCR